MPNLLKDQIQGSPLRGLPTHDERFASKSVSISGETIQFYYNNAGTLTADAGQAAGTAVVAMTLYSGIMNQLGDTQATSRDNSLTFTSTALTNEKLLSYTDMETMDEMSFVERLAFVQSKTSNVQLSANGDYCVDYNKGVIYGIKASTQTSAASGAYKIRTPYVTTVT